MKVLWILIISLYLLSGCGGEECGIEYDRSAVIWEGTASDSAYLMDAWNAVTDCAGVSKEPNFYIVFVDALTITRNGITSWGSICYGAPDLIVIPTQGWPYTWIMEVVLHEFYHSATRLGAEYHETNEFLNCTRDINFQSDNIPPWL